MKRVFNIIVCMCLAALVSCVNTNKVDNGNNQPSGDKGALTLSVDTRTTSGETLDYVLRIYQNNGESQKLVRKYTSEETLPPYIWLLEGNYTAVVESGKPETASFNNSYYRGEKDFDIVGGELSTVELIATLQNIPVEVIFDQTIVEGCLEGYYVDVLIADSVAEATSTTPKLHYTESKIGYFVMPEGNTNLAWHFVGTYVYANGEQVDIDKSGVIENVEIKKHYTLRYKYSKDADGYLGDLIVTVDTTLDERDDHIAFNPDPELKGVGFDIAELCNYTGGERKYQAKSPAEFNTIMLSVGSTTYDLTTQTIAGVSLEGFGSAELFITLSDDFFNALSGGMQTLQLAVGDKDGGFASKELPYNLQGVNASKKKDINLWTGVGTLSATVFGTPSTVAIECRKVGGEWTSYPASVSGTELYSANASGFLAGQSYEYRLVVDGNYIGANGTLTTEAGAQIPNGDLEDWCDFNGTIVPYHTGINAYWCTGNYGTAALGKNITNESSEVRPGSTGKKSAYMKSEYIVVKFAAGNMYVGSWGGMSGTDATVYFGQPFTYNAKPKAIRFWAKWNCGTIDYASGGGCSKGDPDLCKIFCCMTTDSHKVDSADANGTSFSPSPENMASGDARYDKVLYSAYMETTESQSEWTQIEIPFVFYGQDPNQIPTHIILTFTCSGYGDYFSGSTSSKLYVDDIELVY